MKQNLLLHICCAPDATVVIERLRSEYDITAFFYNPNIHPENEHNLRLQEMLELAEKLKIPCKYAEYDAQNWFALVKGHESVPEGGSRCEICFRMRLEKTAQFAAAERFDLFTTVLSVSPHKNADLINQIGIKVGETYHIPFMEANFKKQDGFKRSLELSRYYGLYRQDYCGCIFSKKEREVWRKQKEDTA